MHTKACSQGPRCRSAARALGAWLPEAQIQQQMLILTRKPSKSKREEKTFPCLLQTGEGFSSRLDRHAFGIVPLLRTCRPVPGLHAACLARGRARPEPGHAIPAQRFSGLVGKSWQQVLRILGRNPQGLADWSKSLKTNIKDFSFFEIQRVHKSLWVSPKDSQDLLPGLANKS